MRDELFGGDFLEEDDTNWEEFEWIPCPCCEDLEMDQDDCEFKIFEGSCPILPDREE